MAGRAGDPTVNDDLVVWRCSVVGAPPHWPVLQVLAVKHPQVHGQAQSRAAARGRTRQVLLQQAGPDTAWPVLAAERGDTGAGRVSISHEDGFSLVAWCERGCIGIDVVGPRGLAGASPEELERMTSLYLGTDPAGTAAVTPAGQSCQQRFAMAWARHEAQLKCLGLGLDECSAALHTRLSNCRTARVALPPSVTCDAAALEAWIAWRDMPD